MAKEIERKFLVDKTKWQAVSKGMLLSQGYLSATENTTVRVRTTADKGFLTIKGKTQGFSRDEYEYIIPLQDAQEMLTMCSDKLVTKY
nr:CYTH domain-containing protein [Paludibacteraceae bacterium]